MAPAMALARALIDVEQLIRWAYRDELIKRQTSAADGLWDTIALGLGRDGDSPSGAQRYAYIGEPHPDAELVEREIATLGNVVIDWPKRGLFIMGDLLGLLDAHATLTIGYFSARAWVIQHASMGTRPRWQMETPRCYSTPAARGPGVMIVGECRGHHLYSTGSHCPIRWEPPIRDIAIARAEYVVWHDALSALARVLSGKLERYEPTGPEASPNPWHNPDVIPVVLPSKIQRSLKPLPLKYPRRAPRRRLRA